MAPHHTFWLVAPSAGEPAGEKTKVKNKNEDGICWKFSQRLWNLWPKPDTTAKFQNSKPTNTLNIRVCRMVPL